MKSIYVLLTKSNTFVSKTIGVATGAPYTHASISFDRQLTKLYSFARQTPFFPLPAGIVQENLEYGYFSRHLDIPCRVYELHVPDHVYEKAVTRVEQMMSSSTEYHYSLLGLFLCRMDIAFDRERHYFCSQFVGEILQQSGALELPKAASLMQPMDYASLPDLTLIYEGTLKSAVSDPQPETRFAGNGRYIYDATETQFI